MARSSTSFRRLSTQCCIAGGGPAGMMLALLLAKNGVHVTVLEKHGDFLRDFRGDTVHPSTLEVLQELGLKERFDELPQQRVSQLKALTADGFQPVVDFRDLSPFPYLSLVPQWDFLSFLEDEARRYPGFELHMRAEVTQLQRDGQRVTGVIAHTPDGPLLVDAPLVVGCDGRSSCVRAESGLSVHTLGAPMDVLWFRLPREATDPEDTFGAIGRGHFMVMLQRGDYWQIAFVIAKGSAAQLRAQPIAQLQQAVAQRVSFMADRVGLLGSWDDVKLLEVRVDRLDRWFSEGLLMIGDAAHAMSPIGGVGINLAIQDAVAAANLLVPELRSRSVPRNSVLARVQLRRALPTRVIQSVQVQIQEHVIAPLLNAQDAPLIELPPLLRAALSMSAIRSIPARLFGVGLLREHVAPFLRAGNG